jgi:hypothetical protein
MLQRDKLGTRREPVLSASNPQRYPCHVQRLRPQHLEIHSLRLTTGSLSSGTSYAPESEVCLGMPLKFGL